MGTWDRMVFASKGGTSMETQYWKLKDDEPLEAQAGPGGPPAAAGGSGGLPHGDGVRSGADGLNGEACRKIFAAKGQPADNPLILHISEKEESSSHFWSFSHGGKLMEPSGPVL